MTQAGRLTVRELDGRRTEIGVEVDANGTVHVQPGGAFTTTHLADHVYRVAGHDGETSVMVVRDRDALWLFSNGNTWRVQVETGQDGRRPSQPGVDHNLSAPMPATVVRVLVETGQAVAQGEIVIVLEAMKMEHRITCSRPGIVKELRVRVGEQVDAGQVMLVIEDEEGKS